MVVELPNPLEQLRPAGLHRLIFRDQKPPLLQIIAFNRPVVAVVAHRIVLQWSDPISELVNMHNCARGEAIDLAGRSVSYGGRVGSTRLRPAFADAEKTGIIERPDRPQANLPCRACGSRNDPQIACLTRSQTQISRR